MWNQAWEKWCLSQEQMNLLELVIHNECFWYLFLYFTLFDFLVHNQNSSTGLHVNRAKTNAVDMIWNINNWKNVTNPEGFTPLMRSDPLWRTMLVIKGKLCSRGSWLDWIAQWDFLLKRSCQILHILLS